jgi:hypothetical protein
VNSVLPADQVASFTATGMMPHAIPFVKRTVATA